MNLETIAIGIILAPFILLFLIKMLVMFIMILGFGAGSHVRQHNDHKGNQ